MKCLKSKTQQSQERESLSVQGSVWRGPVYLIENKRTFWANEHVLGGKMADP